MAGACGVVDLEVAKDRSSDASEVADELEKEENGGLECSETVEEVKVEASVSSAEVEKQAAKEESAAFSPADRDAVEGISPSDPKKESTGVAQVTTLETEVSFVDDEQKSQEAGCTEGHHTEDTKLAVAAVEMHPQVSSIGTHQGFQDEDDGRIGSPVDLVAKDPVLEDLCRGETGVCDVDMVDAAHASAEPEPVDEVGVVHAQSLGSESEANDESMLNLQKEDLGNQTDRVAKEQPPSNSTVEVQNQEIGGETEESNEPVMDDSQGRDHKAYIRNIEEGDVVLDTAAVDDTLGHQADRGIVDTNLADTVPEVEPQVKEGDTDVGRDSVMDNYHAEDEDASISKTNPVMTDKGNEEGDGSFDSVPVGDVIDHQAEIYLDDPTGKALAKERGVDTDVDDGHIMKVDEVKDGVRGVHQVSSMQISSVETSQDLQEGDNELKPSHIDSNIDSPADLVKDSITADPEVEEQPQATGREMEVVNVEIMDVDQDSNVGTTAGPNRAAPVVVVVQTQVICQEAEAGNESMMNLPKDTTTVGDIINLQADCVSEHANLDDLDVKSQSEIRSIEADGYDGFMMKGGEGKDHKVSGSHTSLTETNQNSQVELETVLDSVPVELGHFTKHPDQVNLVKQPEVSAGSDADGDQERKNEASACESSLMKTNQQIQEEGNTLFNPVVVDEAVDYQAVCAAEEKHLITRGSVITSTLDGLRTLSVTEAEKEDANPVIDEPLGSDDSLKPGMHLAQNCADLAAASSESLPVQVCAMTEGDTTIVGFGCVADSSCSKEQEAFVSKMHLVENTREDEKLLDSFSVGDKINHQADCASQDPDLVDPSIELKARIENIEADGSDRFVMEGDESKDQEASILCASLTATNQDVLEESDTLLDSVPPEADYCTNDTNQVNPSMEVESVIVRTEIEVSDRPEVDADQDRDREASALKSSLVEIQGEGNTLFNSVSVDDTIDHKVNCMPLDKNLTTGFGIVTAKLDGVMSVSVAELENGDANSVNDSSLGSKYSVVSGTDLTKNFAKSGAQSADTHPLDENTMVQGDVTTADANPVIELQSQDIQMVDHNLMGKQDTTELVSCSVVEPVNCGIGSLGEKLMVTGDTVLENSSSVVETNTWRASGLSEIHTLPSQGKGYVDLLQDADLDTEMQLVGISVAESICANAHKLESSLGKSQIIVTDSEVINNGMPQASACNRVESIQELEAKQEIQDPNNEGSSLKDEDAGGKQNVEVGKGELLKGTEKQAVECLDTSIGGIPGMENKQHISYNLNFEDTANFSTSDLVWGKVKSHPWWPGQIIDPSDASQLALKYQKKDNFLVAYFGDKTFAWCDDSRLKPFYSYFSQMEKQCSSDTFATAMNDILVEISRRVELGMTCSCFPYESYANIKFQKVDNAGVQKGNVTSILDRPQILNYFQPGELIEYIKTLAQFPNGGVDRLELVTAKSQLKAFYCSKGYPELPIFTVHGGLIEDVAEIPLYNVKGSGEDNAEHSTPDVPGLGSGKGKLRSSDNSSKKRKHVLEDDGKQKSTSGLTNEENALHLGDDGKSKSGLEASETLILSSFGMKHTVLGSDSTDPGRHKKRTPDFFGDIEPTSPSPTVISSFKIGEFIRRAASQLTGAQSIVKCQQESTPNNALQTDPRKGVVTDFDVLPHAPEENKEPETSLSENNSSPDEMLSQLCLAARDPMNGDSSVSMMVDFFSSFRNSCVSCIREGKKHVEKRKRGRPRKVISQPLFSELFSDISSSEEKPVEKRKRCRPKKYSETAISDFGSSGEKHVKKCSSENQHVEKRRRGRPKKVISQPAISDIGSSEEKHAEKRKRGRPRKVTSQLASSDMSTPDHMKDSYWSDTNIQKRPRKKSLSDLKRKGESHEKIRQKRMSAGGRPHSLPSVSMLENEQKLPLVAMNTNIKYSFIAERPIISVAEKIVDERMPTALILSFNSSDTLPSPTDLIRIFSRYGPLKEAETDVVIKTNRAKVVFKRRVDAEAAFSSAGKYSIFGPGLLSYQLKSLPLTTESSQQTTQVQHDAVSATKPQENHDTASIVVPQDYLNQAISTLQGDHDQAISVAQNEHVEDLMTTPQDKHDTTASVVIPQGNLNPTIATLQGDHDQVISIAQNEHDEDPMTTPQDNHETTASASKPEENHDTASIVIPQGNLNPTIATLQGDHDQVISVARNEHDEDPMTTPQDDHYTTASVVIPQENHDTTSIVIPQDNLNLTIANLQGDHDQAILVAPNEHDEELMTTPEDKNDTTLVNRPQNDDSRAITTPDETKDAELMQGCNLETSEVADCGIASDIILVEAETKLSLQVKCDAASIPQPEHYHDAASIPTPGKKKDAGLMQGCKVEISELAEGGIALDTILVEAEAELPQGKYDATSIPPPKEYHDAAPIAAPQDKLDSTIISTAGDYHDAAPITSTQDQYETTQIENNSSLTEDKHDATVTTEHSDYHDAAPIVASPDYHDATPNTASQEYQDATPTTALQENYEATQGV